MANLRCHCLYKAFDGVHALYNVSLALPQSGIVAVVGPNGAGKSTLLDVMTGFSRPDSGRVLLGDQDITRLPPHRISRLGIARTFQDLRLVRRVSSLENVMFARQRASTESLFRAVFQFGIRKDEAENREAALELLSLVGLEHEAHNCAGELSYGQQKLLSVAMCLANDANVLLLDEPIAAVHPEIAQRLLGLLLKIKKRGKLILFIEHDMSAVRKTADTVIVMDDGRVIAEGPPGETLEQSRIMEAYIG